MITYSVMKTRDCLEELLPLLTKHYKEVSLLGRYELKPNYKMYYALDDTDKCKVVVAKNDEKIVGYIVFFLGQHAHYIDCNLAIEDIYYVLPEYRKGRIAIKMFQYAEEYLKSIGINMIRYTTKTHIDNSALFEYLKYENTEKVFTKMIG